MKKATILYPIILILAMVIVTVGFNKGSEKKIDTGVITRETTQITNVIESKDVSYVPVIIETMDNLSSRSYYPVYTITPTSTPTPVPTTAPEATYIPEPIEILIVETTVDVPEEIALIENETSYYNQCGLSEEDFEFFARVVAAEDNGDHENDYDNQVAIAQVIWNRVDSPNWPNTVREVLTQKNPKQFSTVKNGDCHTTTNDNCRKAIVDAYVNRPHPANVIYFNCIGFSSSLEPYMQISDNYFSYE